MSKRFFTSDWHLGMETLLNSHIMKEEVRPFLDINQMNNTIVKIANTQAKEEDIIIHVGDLACYSSNFKPNYILAQINATIINIHGNHDTSNKVKSLCSSMRTTLGKKYTSVSISHYPTYDKRAIGQFLEGDIHICGHVHSRWKHCLDLTHKCLNINVSIDAWNYKLLSEEDLIKYVDNLLYSEVRITNKVKITEIGKIVKV